MIRTHRLTAVNPGRMGTAFVAFTMLVGACTATPSASPELSPALSEPSVPTASAATESTTPSPTESPSPPPPPLFPCGDPDPTCASVRVQQLTSIPYTDPVSCSSSGDQCLLRVDSFAVPDAGDVPIVVMIPGGPLPPGNRTYLWPLARWVAARGAVVFTADYRSSPAYGGGFPTTFGDVACAIRFARERGAALGGDASRVTLVAHSYGAFPGAVVALSAHDFATDEPSCLAHVGVGRPDGFVGVAGLYTFDAIGSGFLANFFGGDRSAATSRWLASDATFLPGLAGHPTPAIALLTGTEDSVSPRSRTDALVAALTPTRGFDAVRVNIEGATHDSILSARLTVDTIGALMRRP